MIDFDDIDNVSPMEDDGYDDVREDEDEYEDEDRDDVIGWLDIDSLAGSDSFSNDDDEDDWE